MTFAFLKNNPWAEPPLQLAQRIAISKTPALKIQKGLNLLLQRPQECHPCLIAAALNIRGRLKNRCAGFQTTFLLKTFIAETSQLLKNQL
ncbi:hypothetical protein K6120_06185 [Neisseria flava]|uniref:hypothetical protein n=1 Tax=Neisseria TaxID=482 RepID=UPI0008A93B8E|nr:MULTISPECIES: hypothetical protein [Neisseria]MBY6283699.1 hypothetical protein [Neisseria flava]OHR41394.1 hypothetical protein HMPREF2936_05945 [Neisseria sp. HMSC064F04]